MSSDNQRQRERLIYGVWYWDHSETRRGTLVLRRESLLPRGWGQRFDFQEDGTLIDAYSARCGNDAGIHNWSGKWELDRERNLLLMKIEKVVFGGYMTSNHPCNPPEDYKRGRNFFIIELTEQRMVLSPVNAVHTAVDLSPNKILPGQDDLTVLKSLSPHSAIEFFGTLLALL